VTAEIPLPVAHLLGTKLRVKDSPKRALWGRVSGTSPHFEPTLNAPQCSMCFVRV